jgi:preprotein translocase subunit YajC
MIFPGKRVHDDTGMAGRVIRLEEHFGSMLVVILADDGKTWTAWEAALTVEDQR